MSFIIQPSDIHKPVAKWYSEYLQSPKWIQFKAKLAVRRGSLCERCKVNPYFSLHHKTYARLFNELPVDVELLCKECHTLAHKHDDIPFLQLIYAAQQSRANVEHVLQLFKNQPQINKPNKRTAKR